MVLLAPSILSADFCNLERDIRAVEAAGCDWIHVDVMDGHFVPNLTIGPPVVAALRKVTKLPLDVHLMIEHPDRYLQDFADAGADIITVHAEACTHLERTLAAIRKLGRKAGVALNPHTHENALSYVLHTVDLVLLMTVNPGFGGQSFMPSVLPKIAAVRAMLTAAGSSAHLEIDGGVATSTIQAVTRAGADVLVAGNAIFKQPSIPDAVSALRNAARA